MEYHTLAPYNVSYVSSKMILDTFVQSPRIFWAISREKRQCRELVNKFDPDLIITDNRYGFRHPSIPSIMITHQLQPILGNSFLEKLGWSILNLFLKKFDEVWIPDHPIPNHLCGSLVEGEHPYPRFFLGTLSRFKKQSISQSYQWTAILSGPEPQRSYLEKKLRQQMALLPGQKLLIRGIPGAENEHIDDQFQVLGFCYGKQMENILNSSEYVISRSGYSSIMDYASLHLQGILIPTPGQSEQEFLAKYLSSQNWFVSQSQRDLNLQEAALKVKDLQPWIPPSSGSFETIIDKRLAALGI